MKSLNNNPVQVSQVNPQETMVSSQRVVDSIENNQKRFSAADLWQIQRNYRTSQIRRWH